MSWIEFWDAKPPIYVSDRHKEAHCRGVANGIIDQISTLGSLAVLDYGCGEALAARDVAKKTRHLYLFDAAPSVQADLRRRLDTLTNVTVLTGAAIQRLPGESIDLIVVNSVIQYLDTAALAEATETWKRLLSANGRIFLADVIPRGVGPATDAWALLRFAAAEGFLVDAVAGLVRTYFSSYRKLRADLGLSRFDAEEFVDVLRRHDLTAHRVHPNLGHNQSRMAFMASLRPGPVGRLACAPARSHEHRP